MIFHATFKKNYIQTNQQMKWEKRNAQEWH